MLIALILWGLLTVPVTLDTQETEPHALVNKIFFLDNGLKNLYLKKSFKNTESRVGKSSQRKKKRIFSPVGT